MAFLPTQAGQLPIDPQTMMPPVQGQPAAPTTGQATASPQPTIAGTAALSDTPETDQTLPMPPQSGGASIGQQLAAKGSPFLNNLSKGTNAAATAAGPASAAPGGWARSLLSGAMSALGSGNGISDSLSDAAVATEPVPPGGGALTGVLRTLQAGQQRKAQQTELASKEKTAQLLRAETTQRIAANTRNTYRQAQEDRTAAYNSNSSFMSTLRKRYNTQDDQDNVTQDQLNQMIKDPDFWKDHTGRATGEEPVMEGGKPKIGPDGQPVMSPLYSISNTKNDTERTKPITAAESQYIKNNAGDNISPGTELTLANLDNVMVRADSARAAKQKIEKANDEDMSQDQARQLNVVMNDPRIQHYMASNPGEPLAGLYGAQRNVQAHVGAIDQMIQSVQQKVPPAQNGQPNPTVDALQQKKQEFIQEGQNVDKAISGFSEKAKNDYVQRMDDLAKQTEVERKDRADEFYKNEELKAKKGEYLGDPNATSPEAFLNSLPPTSKSVVQLIGTGKAPINNPGYLLARNPAILEAVARAYPEFDISKVKSYQDTYKAFTEGKDAEQIKNGATALGHLQELQQLNTVASHIPHTPAWTAYQNKAETLSGELASFYGTNTVSGREDIRNTLTSTLPGNREAAINTQAQSMGDKFDNIEQQWKNAAPSKAYEAPLPGMSLQAKQARAKLDPDYAAQHPELGVKSSQQAPTTVAPQIAIKDASGKIIGYK